MPLPDDLDELNANSYYGTLGIRIVERTDGRVRSELRPTPAMRWPDPAYVHGGVLFTQLDTTMATAVMTGTQTQASCSTISLNIQFLAPAKSAVFYCTATMERRGGRVCFLTGRTLADDGELVALAQGSFRVFMPES